MEQPFMIAAFIRAFGEMTTLKLLYPKTKIPADKAPTKRF